MKTQGSSQSKEGKNGKKKYDAQYIRSLLMGGVFGGVAGCSILFAMGAERIAEQTKLEFLCSYMGLVLFMIVSYLIHMIIHEGGHLLFGLLSGYKFCSFRVGSIMLQKYEDGLKWKRFSLAGTGGQCLMEPVDVEMEQFPTVLYNLGGILVNLIVAAAGILGAILVTRESVWFPFLLELGIIGIAVAVFNGVPIQGTVPNDGWNAIHFAKNTNLKKLFWCQLKINALQVRGVRLKDMPQEWFALPEEGTDGTGSLKDMPQEWFALPEEGTDGTGIMLAFSENRAMDLHDFATAQSLIDRMLEENTVGIYKALCLADQAYISVLQHGTQASLSMLEEKEIAMILKQMRKYPSVLRANYAIALLKEQDTEKAAAIKAEYQKVTETYPLQADLASEAELFALADQQAEQCQKKEQS
ncbi:MAG: hypothetical protein IJV50_09340 [Lachnospiraceae bacterium]|nr:hypothetical protein [Lachnospiraceae bacterium]